MTYYSCQSCGWKADEDAKFCAHCATKLDKTEYTKKCQRCGCEVAYSGQAPNYCRMCGSPLSPDENRSKPQPL